MNLLTKYAIPGALIAIIARMIYFIWLSPDEDWDMYVRFLYLLLFLLSLFMSLRAFKQAHRQSDFTQDIKSGMKTASLFSLIIAAFTWLYYKWINPGYFENKIAEAVTNAELAGADLEKTQNTVEFIFNAFTHATITLFGMMVIGFFYTIILVLLMRAKPEVFLR